MNYIEPLADGRGFSITNAAFRHFITYNRLEGVHSRLEWGLNRKGFSNLEAIGREARELILHVRIPNDLAEAISDAYHESFATDYSQVTLTSFTSYADLSPVDTSVPGSICIPVPGEAELLDAVKQGFASLYTDDAIRYRADHHLECSEISYQLEIRQLPV